MTAFRLAEQAGRIDVDRMLDEIGPAQFEEWCKKDEIEPIGQPRMLGMIAYFLATQIFDEKPEPSDFMPWLAYEPKPTHDNAKARQILKQALGK